MIGWILFLLLLWVSPSFAAITVDTVSSSSGTTSTSHSHTIAADSNAIIVCVASRDDAGSATAPTSVTVAGAAATLLDGMVNGSNTTHRMDIYYKLTPTTGAQTVAATGHASTDHMVTGALSLKNIAQTSTFNTVHKTDSQEKDLSDGTNMDNDAIASAVGEFGIACGSARGNTQSATPDGTAPTSTERVDLIVDDGGAPLTGIMYTEDGAATSINIRVDLNTNASWTTVGVSIREAAAAATGRSISPIVFQ